MNTLVITSRLCTYNLSFDSFVFIITQVSYLRECTNIHISCHASESFASLFAVRLFLTPLWSTQDWEVAGACNITSPTVTYLDRDRDVVWHQLSPMKTSRKVSEKLCIPGVFVEIVEGCWGICVDWFIDICANIYICILQIYIYIYIQIDDPNMIDHVDSMEMLKGIVFWQVFFSI